MSDDDWDNEDFEIPIVSKKFSDEEEEEEESNVTKSTTNKPKPKKKPKAERIAEKKMEAQAAAVKVVEEPEETEHERKLRLAQSVIESDLENARALVGDMGDLQISRNLVTFHPVSKADFEEYGKMIVEKFGSFEESDHYPYFCELILRDMIVSLNLDDTRKLSSTLTAMINEKQKLNKSTKKKKQKRAVNVQKDDLDAMRFDNSYDDFDDFM